MTNSNTATNQLRYRAWDEAKLRWTVDHDMLAITFNGDIIHASDTGISTRNDLEVSRFIGLFDNNGVKIYERDIVEWSGSRGSRKLTGTVVFRNGSFIYETVDGEWDFPNQVVVVVLGNAHENPELLKKGIL